MVHIFRLSHNGQVTSLYGNTANTNKTQDPARQEERTEKGCSEAGP